MPATTETSEELKIPLDLSEWVPVPELRQWITSQVETLDWSNPELLKVLRLHPEFEPRALMNTMTFGYAVGIFGAEEIARNCSTNPDFRGIRPKLPPVVSDLKQFRKENRGLLRWTLVGVLTEALRSQFIERDEMTVLPSGLRRYVSDNARERLEIARHLDRSEDLL